MHPETAEIARKGQRIYQDKLKATLERDHKGEIVAIDVDTGDYFLGKTVLEAAERGHEKYPGKVFHAIRVGYKVVHFVGGGK